VTALAPADTDGAIDAAQTLDLTVVIVSYNTRGLLEDCLRSLYDGGLDNISSEVRVVDNASEDGSAALVRSAFPQVLLEANGENIGFARANNQALRQADARYFLLLNSDTLVPPGALAGLIGVMDRRPEAAVCSPLLTNEDGSPQFCWARFPGFRSEVAGALDLGQSPYPLGDYADPARRAKMEPFPVDWVGGACFLVRARSTESVGLLDEAFFMYSEETDWCRRFRGIGARTLLVPAVTVTHLGGRSSRRVPEATRTRMYRSHLRLLRLLYGPIGGLPASAVAAARYALFRLRARAAKGAR
jgi:GT2 family glycosyltransferase